ncbi:MAG TPA: PEP/pyruvate-binding domain-containing protein, partial [Polyangia bacterium]|nr:PEP/pyruvate-binding domain-containing protein [Polyangia bacterium]
DDARIGGKARSLLRLAAAGAPVPRGFAVSTALFRALRAAGPPLPATLGDEDALTRARGAATALAAAPWPDGFLGELAAAAAALDATPTARFSVRSSATLEDRADAVGAGIFLSRTDVAAPDVPAAVRDVLGAALAPAALAYAARRGLPIADLEMAVLVHPFTRGDAAGTAAFDPARDDAPMIDPAPSGAARAAIIGVTRALAARDGAIEIEWVATGDDVLFLQLRPYRAPTPCPWSGAAQLADAAWRWDAAHNPLPLSPAHAGLVALVDARCRTGFRQRVVEGYLFAAPVTKLSARPDDDAARALRALTRDAEARLAALGDAPSLDDALGAFLRIYEPLFGVVQPAARAARDALQSFLRAHARREPIAELLRGVPSLATERHRRADAIARAEDAGARDEAVAAYVARFGDEAPAWDVAAPTYAEDAGPLERVGARSSAPRGEARDVEAAFAEALPPALRAEGRRLVADARAAVAVAEDDDALYARAQAVVRHALLREGRRLQAANVLARADDVFWLPLEAVRSGAPLTAAAVTHAIAGARAAHAAALADPPPPPDARPGWDDRAMGVRGRGAASGRALGRVHLHDVAAPVPSGAVLVARTLLPTELPLLAPAALVVETGGPLGHVAAQARERNLPAVVDAAGACAAFRQGDLVLVDGDAGLVIRIGD